MSESVLPSRGRVRGVRARARVRGVRARARVRGVRVRVVRVVSEFGAHLAGQRRVISPHISPYLPISHLAGRRRVRRAAELGASILRGEDTGVGAGGRPRAVCSVLGGSREYTGYNAAECSPSTCPLECWPEHTGLSSCLRSSLIYCSRSPRAERSSDSAAETSASAPVTITARSFARGGCCKSPHWSSRARAWSGEARGEITRSTQWTAIALLQPSLRPSIQWLTSGFPSTTSRLHRLCSRSLPTVSPPRPMMRPEQSLGMMYTVQLELAAGGSGGAATAGARVGPFATTGPREMMGPRWITEGPAAVRSGRSAAAAAAAAAAAPSTRAASPGRSLSAAAAARAAAMPALMSAPLSILE